MVDAGHMAALAAAIGFIVSCAVSYWTGRYWRRRVRYWRDQALRATRESGRDPVEESWQ